VSRARMPPHLRWNARRERRGHDSRDQTPPGGSQLAREHATPPPLSTEPEELAMRAPGTSGPTLSCATGRYVDAKVVEAAGDVSIASSQLLKRRVGSFTHDVPPLELARARR
jgi:hypothetical protein